MVALLHNCPANSQRYNFWAKVTTEMINMWFKSASCVTADNNQKNEYCDHWRDNTNSILQGFVVVVVFTKKCVKVMTILSLIFFKRIIYRQRYLFNFDNKMTISPRKVRHVSPSRDVWIRLDAKYLHMDIFDQNLKKV